MKKLPSDHRRDRDGVEPSRGEREGGVGEANAGRVWLFFFLYLLPSSVKDPSTAKAVPLPSRFQRKGTAFGPSVRPRRGWRARRCGATPVRHPQKSLPRREGSSVISRHTIGTYPSASAQSAADRPSWPHGRVFPALRFRRSPSDLHFLLYSRLRHKPVSLQSRPPPGR